MKCFTAVTCLIFLGVHASALASPSAGKQWWDPRNRDTFWELSDTHGVPPPGFLDDHKRASLTLITTSKAVKEAIRVGGFAAYSKPTGQQLQAAIKILDTAVESGEESLPLAYLRIQVLAVMGKEPDHETRLVLARYKKRPSPYLAYEVALCEWWGKFKAKDRTLKYFSPGPLYKWKSWSPATEKEESVHSLITCTTSIQVGRVQIPPINAAEYFGHPELFEWLGFHYSEGHIFGNTGKFVRNGEKLPFPFTAPSIETLQMYLSRSSDQHPKRYLSALLAFRRSRDLGMTKQALVYAKRYLANAPDYSRSKQEAKNYIAKHG